MRTTPRSWPRWAATCARRASAAAWRARCCRRIAECLERYLAQLEAGEGNASVLLLRSVARALGVPMTELLEPRENSVEQRLIRRFLDGCRSIASRTSCSA